MDLIDTIEGRGRAPSLVLALIERLPDTSYTTALASGGQAFFGWGSLQHLLADIYDALSLNTQASGNWGGKPPKIPHYPRPAAEAEQKPVTVADFFKQFQPGTH